MPSVEPGYLLELLDTEMPSKPQSWSLIFEDINRYIKPGLTHWQSPNMHAFYPTATSFPSIVGELLSAAFGVVGFNWVNFLTTYLYYIILFHIFKVKWLEGVIKGMFDNCGSK